MACCLSLECSMSQGSLALMEFREEVRVLSSKKWLSQKKDHLLENAHSYKLPMEIDKTLKENNKKPLDIDFLAVGVGPGRWTGVRTAVNVARSLSFSLKIPVYTVSSLRICAEPFLSQSKSVFTCINAFNNQVYFAKFQPGKNIKDSPKLLDFKDFCNKIKKMTNPEKKKEKQICISDLEDFYPIPPDLKTKLSFKKIYPNALDLAQIIFNEKKQRKPKSWSQVKAFYLKSPVDSTELSLKNS